MMRSLIYLYQEKVDLALSDATKAIAKYDKKTASKPLCAFYLWRAEIYHTELEDTDKALADQQMAYKYLKKADDAMRRTFFSARAQIYYERKEYNKADEDYGQILKMNESDLYAMIGLARNMLARKEYNAALEMLNNCEKYDSKYEAIYQFRCKVYDEMGETDKAIDDAIRYIEYAEEPHAAIYELIFRKHLTYALAKVQTQIQKDNDYSWKQLRIHIYKWGCDYAAAMTSWSRSMGHPPRFITTEATVTTKSAIPSGLLRILRGLSR